MSELEDFINYAAVHTHLHIITHSAITSHHS